MLIHLEKLGKSFGEKIVLHDVTASVEREDRIGIVGQNGAGKTTLLKILTGEYQDYEGEFSVTHGVTLGYLEQNAKLDATLDIYGEMRSTFAPVLDAMAQVGFTSTIMPYKQLSAELKNHRRYYIDPKYSVPYSFVAAVRKNAYIPHVVQRLIEELHLKQYTF